MGRPSASSGLSNQSNYRGILYRAQQRHTSAFAKWPTSSDGPADGGSQISVIVVATERLFRLGLAGLLSEDGRLNVIGVSDGEADLLELCKSTSVDVVLLDIQLSRSDAIDLVRLIASECPHTKTLVLTSNADWRVRPTMIAGAAGCSAEGHLSRGNQGCGRLRASG